MRTRRWRKGERVQVRVVEVFPDGALLVEHEGALFRVSNESRETVEKNQVLQLFVVSENPLTFRFREQIPWHLDRFA